LLEELLHTYLTKAHETNTAAKAEADRRCSWRVEGVEVNSNVNIYLPEDRISHVSGTWAVLERVRIRDAAALLFVYPRDGALVRRYFEEFMTTSPENSAAESEEQDGVGSEMASGSGIEEWSEQARKKEDREGDDNSECRHAPPRRRGVQLIIWLGPKADWEDTGFGAFDAGDEFEILKMREDVGLAEFEMLATLGRKS
jgi:hypothetical protein